MADNFPVIKCVSLAGNRAIGPYSDAVKAGNLIFASGRIGLDKFADRLVEGGIGPQTRQCLETITEVLELAGSGLGNIIKTTVFLTDMADFAAMNAVYGEVFSERRPARSTVAVAGLPMGALIEIGVVAAQ